MNGMRQLALLIVALRPSSSTLLRGHARQDWELAAPKDVPGSDPQCYDWQDDASLLRKVTAEPVFYANTTAKEAAGTLSALGDALKKHCFGKDWDGALCSSTLNQFRTVTWPHLVREAGSDAHFAHLRSSKAPPLKPFSGGGFGGEVGCRKDGKMSHFFYQHIYKCNGMNIKKNLARLGHLPPTAAHDRDWQVHQRCSQYKQYKNEPITPKPVLFTFVRDPITKFIAGYKEMAARGVIDTMQGAKVGTKAHALNFIDNVFHGSCKNGHVALQVQGLVGELCSSKFDFIGRLEQFDNDWTQLGVEGGCDEDQPLRWPVQRAHNSDTDDFGAEAAMTEALQENGGQLMISLCLWVLPDVVAFGYSLPPECASHDVMHWVPAPES